MTLFPKTPHFQPFPKHSPGFLVIFQGFLNQFCYFCDLNSCYFTAPQNLLHIQKAAYNQEIKRFLTETTEHHKHHRHLNHRNYKHNMAPQHEGLDSLRLMQKVNSFRMQLEIICRVFFSQISGKIKRCISDQNQCIFYIPSAAWYTVLCSSTKIRKYTIFSNNVRS